MNTTDIQIGKKYWIKPTEDASPRPALVLRSANQEPLWFQCVGADGEGFIVFADAFLRPIQMEVRTS